MERALFFGPLKSRDDWRKMLADPTKHWRDGYSAKSLAETWMSAAGLPKSVNSVFAESGIEELKDLYFLVAFPEYDVPLPGGGHASQNDLFVLARSSAGIVPIMVEGKVTEAFGEKIEVWRTNASAGKRQRLAYLLSKLGLTSAIVDPIRYQLVHRTASAVIEAERYGTKSAVVLIHSFSTTYAHFEDYSRFLALFEVSAKKDSVVGPVKMSGIDIYFSWVAEPTTSQ